MNELTRAREVEYEDFEIEVSECRCGYLEVRVLNSPVDRPRAPFHAPYEQGDFEELMGRLAAKPDSKDYRPFRNPEAEAKKIGTKLFQALFPGEIANTLRRSQDGLLGSSQDGSRAGLRLRIAFHNVSEHPEIFGLPWELLYDPQKREFLARGGTTLVVRYQDAPRLTLPPREGRKLRVLAVIARPKDQGKFDVREVKDLLYEAVSSDALIEPRTLRKPTLQGLRDHLLRDPCEVLLFFGHGRFDDDDAQGALVFEDEKGGSDYVSGEELADHLRDFQDLRLAVLLGCKGARLPRQRGQDPLTGVATALVQAGLPAAVAMQQNISIAAAKDFTSAFFSALAMGMPVDAAMGEARLRLQRGQVRPLEWATPVLTQRTRDGRILSLAEDSSPAAMRLGIVSFDDWDRERLDQFEVRCRDLTRFFKGRRIKRPEMWVKQVLPDLKRWLREMAIPGQPYILNFAAHLTLAFAAGRILDVKCRLNLSVVQNDEVWHPEMGHPLQGPVWAEELPVKVLDAAKPDLAVVVSLSRCILPGVEEYLKKGEPRTLGIGSVIDARPTTPVGRNSILDGAHAARLAQELANRLDVEMATRPNCTVHLFLGAPQSFAFLYGRTTKSIPRIQMYEHRFGEGPSAYEPSALFTSTSDL